MKQKIKDEIKCFVCKKNLGRKRKEREGTIQTGNVSVCSERCYRIYVNNKRKREVINKEVDKLNKEINELAIVRDKIKKGVGK